MSDSIVVTLVSQAIMMIILMSAPIVLTAMIVGFTVSILQAITQVQEQTLSFVPKSLCVYGVLILLGPWLLNTMLQYVRHILDNLPVNLLR
ncbi:MAG: flagellar biosynthesis protein FliQ [Candidatus Sericytochromatia bacterium]|nr:flagellar biosynthesis protein FliQ [Candidatus Sericytochromatia bacterium]